MPKKILKRIVAGQISKRNITHYLMSACIIAHFFFLFIAWLFFPENPVYPYEWTTSTISRLGWPHENTQGWIFFSLAEIVLGVSVIPLIPYYYKRYVPLFKKTAIVSTFFFTGASVGCILIGLIPNYPALLNIHSINAVLIFLGFNMLGILSAAMVTAHAKKDQSELLGKKRYLGILYLLSVIYLVLCSVMTISLTIGGAGEQYVFQPGTPLLLRAPFWEWQAFVMILLSTALLFVITPESISPRN